MKQLICDFVFCFQKV